MAFCSVQGGTTAVRQAASSSNSMEGCILCDDHHKKLVGIFLSNINQHNHIYILRVIFHLFVAINFDAAIR